MCSANQKFCIDSSGDSKDRGKLILYEYHGGKNQQFRFQPDNQGGYLIINCENNGALRCSNNKEPGDQCHIGQAGHDAPRWKVV